MIGKTVGNYKIIKELGTGGMGTVYLAENKSIGLKVAIKVLHTHLIKSQNIKKRFLKEAKMQAILDHPSITKVIDYVDNSQGLFIILEYIEGIELNDYLFKTKGLMPEKDAIHYMSEILDAVSYAHSKGVIHRDLKSANIMITPNRGIKIMDFGIAKLAGESLSLTKTGSRIGSPLYMSPEQVTSGNIDHRSDIYSLGVVYHEMLTGLPVYDQNNTTEFEIYNKIVKQPLPRLKFFYKLTSDHSQEVVDTATSKLPEGRFQNCEEFKNAINKKNKEKRAVAKPNKPPYKKKSNNSVAWVFGILSILALVSFGAYYFNNQNKFNANENTFSTEKLNKQGTLKDTIFIQKNFIFESINDSLMPNKIKYKNKFFILGEKLDSLNNIYESVDQFMYLTNNKGEEISTLIAKTNNVKSLINFYVGDTVYLFKEEFIKNKTDTIHDGIEIIETKDKPTIPFNIVENTPIYGYCRGKSKTSLSKCFEKNIKNHLIKNANIKQYNTLGLPDGYLDINYKFDISKQGIPININVWAKNTTIENDVKNVIKSITGIQAGKQDKLNTVVSYSSFFKVRIGEKPKEKIIVQEKDTDGDGVLDKNDECPRVVGTKANKGCPEVTVEILPKNVSSDSLDVFPVYPGCEGKSGTTLKACTNQKILNKLSERIKRFIDRNQDKLNGVTRHKVTGNFIIDRSGNINTIKVTTNNKTLKKEVEKIISFLPKMKAGIYKNVVVGTIFNFGFNFQ